MAVWAMVLIALDGLRKHVDAVPIENANRTDKAGQRPRRVGVGEVVDQVSCEVVDLAVESNNVLVVFRLRVRF